MNILDEIVANKKKELMILSRDKTISDLENSRFFSRKTISLSDSLLESNSPGIIAEFKRRSPSKGIINSLSSVEEVVSGYISEGASAVSVLTDNKYFGGSEADLSIARECGSFPVLRKDFIIDEYQLIEAKSIGADAVLLIAAVLGKEELKKLAEIARSLGLEVLMEIHDLKELDKINQYINIVGVNNRNLKTFDVDINTSIMLADKIPSEFLKISESGISATHVVNDLRKHGYNGFLIGERFMANSDPVKTFGEFVKELIS